MSHSSCWLLLAASLALGQDPLKGIPKGVWSSQGVVWAVHGNALQIGTTSEGFAIRESKILKLKVTKDTRLEQADIGIKDGKIEVSTKVIALKDVSPQQPISVIVVTEGREAVLLRAIVSGPKLGGQLVAD